MRRFIISSEKFAGQAEIFFNDKDTLCRIDCTQTDMDEMTVMHFKQAVPGTIKSLMYDKRFGPGTTIVEAGYEVTFDMFYKDYPLKRNRYKVEKQWEKLNDSDKVKAFHSLHFYKKYLTKENWQKPMIADRYLRDREFETEWNKI